MVSGPLTQGVKNTPSLFNFSETSHLSEQETEILRLTKKILKCRGSQESDAASNVTKYRNQLKKLQKDSPKKSFITDLSKRVLKLSKHSNAWAADKTPLAVCSSTKEVKQHCRLFANIHGDSFIKDSGLEGWHDWSFVKYLKDSLEKTPLGLDKTTKNALSEKIKAAYELLEKRERILDESLEKTGEDWEHFFERECGECASDLRKAFDQGSSSLVHGGWLNSSNETGHALVYEVSPQADGKATFRVYNRGDGVQYHSNPEKRGEKSFFPAYVEIQDVDPDKFFTAKTLSLLWSPLLSDDSQIHSHNTKAHYEQIFSQFGGKKISSEVIEKKLWTSSHNANTCPWKSLTACLRKQMTFSQYKRFLFELKRESLFGFYETHHKKILSDPLKRHLFETALAKYKRSLNKNKFIDRKSRKIYLQDLFFLEQSFSSSKKVFLQQMHKDAKPPSVEVNREAVVVERHEKLIDKKSPNLPMLRRIAPKSRVFCNSDGEPVSMRIPFSSGCVYEFVVTNVKGKKLWECRQMPGYYLHQDPFVGQLEAVGIKDYLRLVTKNGADRVLLSQREPLKSTEIGWGLKLNKRPKNVFYFDVKDSHETSVDQWGG